MPLNVVGYDGELRMQTGRQQMDPEDRLDSWKEIASFLRRDVRTVQRWERNEALPVHRHQHEKLGSVFAFRSELKKWFEGRQREAPVVAAERQPGTERIKLAVLPFVNLSGKAEDEYFSDGLTEELNTAVTVLDPARLAVLARTASAQHAGTRDAIEALRAKLGVDYALQGSVRRAGSRVRIAVQLIELQDQTQLWGENYDRELSDVLSVQAEIARNVAREIHLTLSKSAGLHPRSGSGGQQVKPEAYEAYLRARYSLHGMTPAGIGESVKDFQKAIAADDKYAPAYAGLASALALLAIAPFDAMPPHKVMPRAEAAALKGIELNPLLGEAHTALALVRHHYRWDWPAAEASYRRAIELNPNYAPAHLWYSWMLLALNRNADAQREIERTMGIVQETDPHRLVAVQATRAAAFYFSRNYEECVRECEKARTLDPDHFMVHYLLARAYARLGTRDRAIAQLQSLSKTAREIPLLQAGLGLALAVDGDKQHAASVLKEFETSAAKRYIPETYFGMLYAGLGERDKALAWLEKAFEERADGLTWLGVDPMLDAFRDEPRFQALLGKLGLTQSGVSA